MGGGENSSRISIGVSACLLGHQVRYDGGHKRDEFVTDVLGRFVELVPVCPELELGLGVPRETLRLERRGTAVLMIGSQTGADYTAAMYEYAQRRLDALPALSGYIFKANSPSCGVEGVRIYADQNALSGRGLFAQALIQRWPNLPVEDESRLGQPELRHNFVEGIFAYAKVHRLFMSQWTPTTLADFHSRHELQLKAHSEGAELTLRHLMSHRLDPDELRRRYESGFRQTMSHLPGRAGHLAVLTWMAEKIRPHCSALIYTKIERAIADYESGCAALLIPLRLLRWCSAQFAAENFSCQSYLEPYPIELMEKINP